MSDSLAGRVAFLKLLPFSINELNNNNLLGENPYKAIFKGNYPPLYDVTKKFILEDWFENYIETYLDLDVKEHINHSNLSTFRKFIQMCALYSGQILSILESSFIIHFLEPDLNNLGRALLKTPKMYFVDTGLLCYLLRINSPEELILSPYKGAIVETYAISELLKSRTNQAKKANLSYFRDNKGFEVDTIADWNHTFAIEIKSSSESTQKLSANTQKYLTLRNDTNAKGAVFYLGDLTCKINQIDYVSWKNWGNFTE